MEILDILFVSSFFYNFFKRKIFFLSNSMNFFSHLFRDIWLSKDIFVKRLFDFLNNFLRFFYLFSIFFNEVALVAGRFYLFNLDNFS